MKAGHWYEMDLVYDNGPSVSQTLFNSSLMSVEVLHKVAHRAGARAKLLTLTLLLTGRYRASELVTPAWRYI